MNLKKSSFVPQIVGETASNHIISRNISLIEDIASVALFTSQAKQNGEPFATHMLPSPIAIDKEALAECSSLTVFSRVSIMESTV